MTNYASRAKVVAKRIRTGMVWVDMDAAEEVAELLENLAVVSETQSQNFTSVEFALTYYGEPTRYQVSIDEDCILDGGLRARTALGLLKRAPRSLRLIHGGAS